MGFLELLRRVGLLAGLCGFLWFALESPRVLLEVRRADFAKEYERKFGERRYAVMGAMELGREFIRKNANPGSVEAFAAQTTEHRLLPPGDAKWIEFYRALQANPVYYAIDQAPFTSIRNAIEAGFARTQWSVQYMPVRDAAGSGHIEIWYHTRPRETKAPVDLIYPSRAGAWRWLVGGLLIYALIPWRKRGPGCVSYGRTVPVALDLFGTAFGAAFFALPLYFVNSTAEVLGDEIVMTLALWSIACVCVLLLAWAAWLASFRVLVEPTGLRIETLWGARATPFHELSGAGYTVRNEIKTGIFLRCRDGRLVKLDWASLLGFEVILQAIATAQTPLAEDIPA
jgi:hypothetical protein